MDFSPCIFNTWLISTSSPPRSFCLIFPSIWLVYLIGLIFYTLWGRTVKLWEEKKNFVCLCCLTLMDSTAHPLKTLLQIHLASDISAANHLPNVLVFLNEECFLPSPHLVKWTTRINSLLHSKDSYGRWAGLCLACQTSRYSKEIMIEYAQGWLSVAIPLLSVRILAWC